MLRAKNVSTIITLKEILKDHTIIKPPNLNYNDSVSVRREQEEIKRDPLEKLKKRDLTQD